MINFINQIIQGDCLKVLKQFPDNCIDAVITDPPYALGFMGKEWDTFDKSQFGRKGLEGKNDLKVKKNFEILPRYKNWDSYYEFSFNWAKEVFRVLKPGGHLLAFGGTRTYHRMVCGIEDAGFEIRDCIMWLYGCGFPKSLDISKQLSKMEYKDEAKKWEGWGTALKPAYEPIVVARKPLSERNVALNVLKWGTGGLNIDACRIGTVIIPTQKRGKAVNTNFMSGGFTPEHQGRFPANVILECCCDEVIEGEEEIVSIHDAPDGTFAGGEPNRGSIKNYRKRNVGKSIVHTNPECPCYMLDKQSGINASRFFYCAKASRKERDMGLENLPLKKGGGMKGTEDQTLLTGSGNVRNNLMRNIHPTVKSLRLIEYLVKLVTPPGGLVLDPFAGSGTTCIACKKLGFKFIGIEKEAEYVEIARARVEAIKENRQFELF